MGQSRMSGIAGPRRGWRHAPVGPPRTGDRVCCSVLIPQERGTGGNRARQRATFQRGLSSLLFLFIYTFYLIWKKLVI